LEGNLIENNNQEGIWCGGLEKSDASILDIPKEKSELQDQSGGRVLYCHLK
jgi:hypothetical protein